MSASAFDFYDLGSKILVGVMSGGFAAWIASKLALRKFYREKWWDKNYEAYRTLIDDLIYMRDSYEKLSNYYKAQKNIGVAAIKNPDIDREKMLLIKGRIEIHLYTAALTLSNKTSTAIKKFSCDMKDIDLKALNYEIFPHDAFENLTKAAEKLLHYVIHDARENLGLISLKEKIESMYRD